MAKILISWLGIKHDFTDGKMPINEVGPTCTVHREFWDYDYHLLLSSAKKIEEAPELSHFASYLTKTFKHRIEKLAMAIDDVIDVYEISCKVNSLLYSLQEHEIDIFITPGTPAMQVAWYLAHETLALRTRLFQVRRPEHVKAEGKRVWITLRQSEIPAALMLREERKSKKIDNKFLITESVKPIYDMAEKVAAANNTTVLILGETGAGKEGLAKYIHDRSPRAKGPFITINCAGMGESLLESRLFGYVKGSHNMAAKDTPGLFEDANNGTIFLDEIGDISAYMQQSLLRVLQEKEISRIGESKAREINVRIIAATNRDLDKLCREDKFRWDLYYRLSVVDLTLLSLRERGSKEIEELFDFILEKQTIDFRKPILKVPTIIRKKIFNHSFPGNIRELDNLVERFYATTEGVVTENALPRNFSVVTKEHSLKLNDVVAQHVNKVYEMCGRNMVRTAKTLGVSPTTLRKKLKIK
jgi:two-component system response regulator HydG